MPHGNITHGQTKLKEHKIWYDMIRRCHNPKATNYKNYGGRGIAVCGEWLDSFDVFLSDMGQRPSPNHYIERVNNNAGYCKGNCVWATLDVQNNNKRSNRVIEFNGQRHTVAQWARILNLTETAIRIRLGRGKLPPDVALGTPQAKRGYAISGKPLSPPSQAGKRPWNYGKKNGHTVRSFGQFLEIIKKETNG